MFELTVRGDVAAAHSLRGYDGPCKNLHGHTWRVEVTVISDKLNDIGMVVDFRVIKSKLRDFLCQIDHVNLNDLPHFQNVNPTTEHLAKFIYHGFAKECRPLEIKQVRVWESDSSSVEYHE
jgi:6-pyruvoyltetrahydropterin/6-carboxytetrahydropterin synthase